MQFTDLKLIAPLLQAIQAEGYTIPSPIQAQAIPHGLDGRDILGIAQTGTGKTAAFALPILQRLHLSTAAPAVSTTETNPTGHRNVTPVRPGAASHNRRDSRSSSHSVQRSNRNIRALILAPTRELATQIGESFRVYGKRTGLRTAVVFGGVGQGNQVREIQSGVDILVACPGRLLDLLNQRLIKLSAIEYLVLDEADRMLDMGFMPDIRRVLTHIPAQRQTLLFSATMPSEIQSMADNLLKDPIRIEVAPVATPAERVEHVAYFVSKANKPTLLLKLLGSAEAALPGSGGNRVLVFTRTKRGADKVAMKLTKDGVRAEAIHGDKSQGARERALMNFKRGASPVLVATDLAARGLDVDNISHVVNFDLPNEPETFVHRIGRTGRAGATGFAVSFCDAEEGEFLADIEALIKLRLPQVETHHLHCPTAREAHASHEQRKVQKLSGRGYIPSSRPSADNNGRSRRSLRAAGRPSSGRPGGGGSGRGSFPQPGQSAAPPRADSGRRPSGNDGRREQFSARIDMDERSEPRNPRGREFRRNRDDRNGR